ncbi:Pantothenate kinase 4 [Cichlidogyrus casuarinus]|uniref:Pantothenate kinase 4 n=1 Tax=Cichlidogyrus casuarinus TaxID=1844966 RepID=A0ABD2PMY7_9PLAT
MSAMFLRHEGYLGTIGAFVKALEEFFPDASSSSWLENFSTTTTGEHDHLSQVSSPLVHPTCSPCLSSHGTLKIAENPVEFDQFIGSALRTFPLLRHSNRYFPDTWEITQDEEARNYWLDCFETSIESYQKRAEESEPDKAESSKRAQKFADSYRSFIQLRREFPSARGVLTVRSLLDAKQYFLRENGFWDPFRYQKLVENRAALSSLQDRLQVKFSSIHNYNIIKS